MWKNYSRFGWENYQKLWLNGSLPLSYLLEDSTRWRENYVQTFLERDIPQLGIKIPSQTLRKFWTLIAHYHGQLINYSEISRAFGISAPTVVRYMDILEGTFMIRSLQPWYANIGKRIIKNPKIYFKDSGLYHYFQSINTWQSLQSSPQLGGSFEGFVINHIIHISNISERNYYFWRTHSGSELDLFWQYDQKSYGIEIKYSDAPNSTKSMHSAIKDLNLEKLFVIYPGDKMYKLSEQIIVYPLKNIQRENWFLIE